MIRINKHTIIGSLALSCLLAISIGIVIKHKTSTTRKTENVKLIESEKNEFFTKQQVIEDIDFALNTIKKYHWSCIKEVPQEVLQQKDVEIANLQETTSTIEVWEILSRILNKFHDAHTAACCPNFLCFKELPFQIRHVDNKIFCDSGEFKDAEIVEIDGIKIPDLYKNFKKHFSYEIEEWPHVHFFGRFNSLLASILALSGIDVTRPIEVSFNTDKGIIKKQFGIFRKKLITPPLVSYVIDEEKNLGIFRMDDCQTYYQSMIDDFFADVAKDNIKNIVVDLRNNHGGDSIVMKYFGKYIKKISDSKKLVLRVAVQKGDAVIDNKEIKINEEELKKWMSKDNLFDGNFYILTSNLTFSSGALFTCLFSDNDLATVIGEVPGNSPERFGHRTDNFSLPNSHVIFHTSLKKFYRPDPTKDPIRFTPDIQVKAEDAMDKVYELIKK